MLLKEKLQDYTRMEFVGFVESIWLAVGPQQQALLRHFISIVDMPEGEALLFDPPLAMTLGNEVTAEAVAIYIKLRHNQSGKPAFRDDLLPTVAPSVRPSREQAALQRSTVKQASAWLLVAGIESAGRSSEDVLERFAALLGKFMTGQFAGVQLEDYLTAITQLEIAQDAVNKAVGLFESFGQRLELNWNGAQSDISSPSLNTAVQNEIFNALSRGRDEYRLRLSTVRQRNQELHAQSITVFNGAEKRWQACAQLWVALVSERSRGRWPMPTSPHVYCYRSCRPVLSPGSSSSSSAPCARR